MDRRSCQCDPPDGSRAKKPATTWAFRASFRARGFGWKSQPAIARLNQALAELHSAARADPVRAAEGAILLLERISPAFERVDGSSGSIGSAVDRAVAELVPLISDAEVDERTRRAWLRASSSPTKPTACPTSSGSPIPGASSA